MRKSVRKSANDKQPSDAYVPSFQHISHKSFRSARTNNYRRAFDASMDPPWNKQIVATSVATVDAIVHSQLEDAQSLLNNTKGKQKQGTLSDAELALQTYVNELTSCRAVAADRKMAQSIALAILRDGELVGQAREDEQQSVQDRQLALSLSGQCTTTIGNDAMTRGLLQDSWQDEAALARATALYMSSVEALTSELAIAEEDSEEPMIRAESSSQAMKRRIDSHL